MTQSPTNPMAAAQRLARPEPPRRFYKQAVAAPHEGGFALTLDGHVARTPGRKPVVVASQPVAEALAAEWAAQGDILDPTTMPLTRIVNAAIDRVAGEMVAVGADVVAYSQSDLVCYRAEGPQSLVEAQEEAWGPVVAWVREALGVDLVLAAGVVPVAQDPRIAEAVAETIALLDPLALAALHTATTLTGSAFMALALARGALAPEAAWVAAHVDENWQMSRWGRDEAALAQRQPRWRELEAAALILRGAP